MIIYGQCPTRISLFGGGTDLPEYANTYGGCVLSMAINIRQKMTMYCSDQLMEFNNGKGGHNILPFGADPQFYYRILDKFGINDMHHTKLEASFDGLIESGLGSSASAAVLLIGIINKRLNLGLDRMEIAEKAWEIESEHIFGGKQDQYAAVYGGVNYIEFDSRDKKVKVARLDQGFIESFLPYFVLLYTGFNRKSATIQEGFRELSGPQVEALDKVKATALNGIKAMVDHDYYEVGRLLQQSWEHKKESNKGVTNKAIDDIFHKAFTLGSMGGKLCGSGGGGFALFMVEPKNRQSFIEGMGLEEFDFGICWTGLDVRRLP